MEITYANGKVEKYSKDYKKMQKKLPFEWVKTIKKHMDRLKAAECFGDFLKFCSGCERSLSETRLKIQKFGKNNVKMKVE